MTIIKITIYLAIVMIAISIINTAFAQPVVKKKTTIPMSNINGVPYSYDEMYQINVDGFTVDDKGIYYFMNSEKGWSTIAEYLGNKPVYRKKYSNIFTTLHFYNNRLYLLQQKGSYAEFYTFDNYTMGGINKIDVKLPGHVNSTVGVDSVFVFETIKIGQKKYSSTYYAYNFSGQSIGKISNKYFLPSSFDKLLDDNHSLQYIGKWAENFIFCDFDMDNVGYEKYFLYDKNGKLVNVKRLNTDIFGKGVGKENTNIVRNGILYILGFAKTTAVITELSIPDLFK